MSQFYRAFLAVLAPVLQRDLGVSAEDLASASGLWFLIFALCQLPVGWALDRVGPRLTAGVLFAVAGGGGALMFTMAQGGLTLKLAMMLLGVGCSPVLMASYFIFARIYSPAVFGTLAGVMVGLGNMGNIGASLPLALAVEEMGWRGTGLVLAGVTLVIALGILALVRDPPPLVTGQRGSLLDLLRIPALWFIIPMMMVCYFPAAAIRGLWIGPFYSVVYEAGTEVIGAATLAMGIAMVLGNFAYGPLERLCHSRKWPIFCGNVVALGCLVALWAFPLSGEVAVGVALAALGFFGAAFPLMIAHARAFFPDHLVGRGVTLMNLFGLGAAGVAQMVSSAIYRLTPVTPVEAPFTAIFGWFAVAVALGLCIYVFAQDRTD